MREGGTFYAQNAFSKIDVERTGRFSNEAAVRAQNNPEDKKAKEDLLAAVFPTIQSIVHRFYNAFKKQFGDHITEDDIFSEAAIFVTGRLLNSWNPGREKENNEILSFNNYIKTYLIGNLFGKYKTFIKHQPNFDSLDASQGDDEDSDFTLLDTLPGNDLSPEERDEQEKRAQAAQFLKERLNEFLFTEPVDGAVLMLRKLGPSIFKEWLEKNREVWGGYKVRTKPEEMAIMDKIEKVLDTENITKDGGLTMQAIADILGVSRERISQREKRAIQKISDAVNQESAKVIVDKQNVEAADDLVLKNEKNIFRNTCPLNMAIVMILRFGMGVNWGNEQWNNISQKTLAYVRKQEVPKYLEVFEKIKNGEIEFKRRSADEVIGILGCDVGSIKRMFKKIDEL